MSSKVKDIAAAIDAKKVGAAMNRLTSAMKDASALIATIRREITIALVVNKGADRIVQAKFAQMRRNRKVGKDPDKLIREFSRWVKENLRKGYFDDPAFPDPHDRPYDDVGKKK